MDPTTIPAIINASLQSGGTDPTTTNITGSSITGSTTTPIELIHRTTDTPIHDVHHLGNGFNLLITFLNFLIAFTAIPLNLAVMGFCRTRLNDTVPFLYFTLSTSDLVTSIRWAQNKLSSGPKINS